MKKCIGCKNSFEPHKFRPGQIFCSKKCKWDFYNKRNSELKIKRYSEMRLKCINILGKECVACGSKDYYVFQIDHINGGGSQDKTYKYRYDFHSKVIKDPSWAKKHYQILCANCNYLKQFFPEIFNERYPHAK